jgi:predicted HTH domain antitoxin
LIVSVEIPDQFAGQFPASPAACARELLEAYALRRFAEGKITAGHVGKLLGLSFQQTEQFLHALNAPPDLGPEEHRRGLQNLERAVSR